VACTEDVADEVFPLIKSERSDPRPKIGCWLVGANNVEGGWEKLVVIVSSVVLVPDEEPTSPADDTEELALVANPERQEGPGHKPVRSCKLKAISTSGDIVLELDEEMEASVE
jgi:hypothetical protein